MLIPHPPDWVARAQKALTEELTPFMEEYFWRVDNGTQGDLYRAMCTCKSNVLQQLPETGIPWVRRSGRV
jgi:hypothetical protein